jgi:WD40-like Beta Propeller Repeat
MKFKLGFSFVVLLLFSLSLPSLAAQNVIERVSVSTAGQQANGSSSGASISFDGRFVAFGSSASNLVPNDTNNAFDIFVRDRDANQTTRVSLASAGTQANNFSGSPAISDDGRFVAFSSSASNLVPGDTNTTCDRSQEWVYTTGKNLNGYPNGYISRFYASAPDGVFLFNRPYSPGDGTTYYPIRIAASRQHVYVAYGTYDGANYHMRYLAQLDSNMQRQWIVDIRNANGTIPLIWDVAAYGDYAYTANYWFGFGSHNFIRYRASDGNTSTSTILYVLSYPNGTSYHYPPQFIAASRAGIMMYWIDSFFGGSYVGQTDFLQPSYTFGIDELYRDLARQWDDIAVLEDFAYLVNENSLGLIFKIRPTEGIIWQKIAKYSDTGPYPKRLSASGDYLYVSYGDQYVAQLDAETLQQKWVTNSFYPILDIAAVSDTSLAPGTDPNCSDIFVHDRQTHETTRVSVSSAGLQGNFFSYDPAISADGRYVVFESYANNLVPNDTNVCDYYTGAGHCRDIFVYDRSTQQIARASVDSTGNEANKLSLEAVISPDGRYLAFWSAASNLVANDTNNARDVFIHDRSTGVTTRASTSTSGTQASFHSYTPDLSADGRYVTFLSYATNLIANTTTSFGNIFVRDTTTGVVTLVSAAYNGAQANAASAFRPTISDDGRFIAYASQASNLVPADTNNMQDIFVYDATTGATGRLSVSASGQQGNSFSFDPAISGNGQFVAFVSGSSNLVINDTNNNTDIFIAALPVPRPPTLNYYPAPSITLSWNSISWATSYWVQVADNGNFSGPLVFDDPNLAANILSVNVAITEGTYYWRVRAKNESAVWGSWSAPEMFVVAPET